MLFNIISFSNELSVVTLISQFPFIEREIGFKEPVDPNRSVRANESVKKALSGCPPKSGPASLGSPVNLSFIFLWVKRT